MEKRVIEYWFPIKSVGIEGKKEKQVAIGRIPSIHQYHARRPTCAARAIILASLLKVPVNDEDLVDLFHLISQYGLRNIPNKIEFRSKNINLIDRINNILKDQSIKSKELKAFDPFAGGGTFSLESHNLGLTTYSSDLNPIAILIQKATILYPHKFGFKLLKFLEIYFNKVNEIMKKDLDNIYKNNVNPDYDINFFIWARQIICPECNLIIPLIKNFRLSKKYEWALIPKIIEDSNEIKFSIGWPNLSKGYYSWGKVICPRCKKTISRDNVMQMVKENKEHRMIAIYENKPDPDASAQGSFRIPSLKEINNGYFPRDEIIKDLINNFPEIDLKFQEKVSAWGIQNYGITTILKCFNSRQLHLLKKLLDIIIQLKKNIKEEIDDPELYEAIILYLTFGLSKMVDFNSTLTQLKSTKNPGIGNTWTRPGLFMKGMPYVECNPLKEKTTGGWLTYFNSLKKALTNLITSQNIKNDLIFIKQMDAMALDYPNESMDYCFTDPPYYDNVPYAAAGDYFYPWIKILLNSIFPELFLTKSTPKEDEIVQDSFRQGGTKKAKIFYEKGMGKAFSEIYRVLKNNGLAVIIFAHKDTTAWETLLQAIINSGLVITNSWPLMMESSSPMRTIDVVSLDSVILLVCRKKPRIGQRYYDEEFRNNLEKKIRLKLERQWRLGFRGADFFLSALGPAIEEFSQFITVLDIKSDGPIKLKEYLDFIDKILVKFSLGKVLDREETSTDSHTQLYLVWRQSYKLARLPYDEIWKFTHALGLDDKKLEGKLLKKVRIKSKTVYQCLDTFDKKEIFLDKKFIPSSLIEALQYSGFLWSENSPSLDLLMEEYQQIYGEEFWHVAQALINLIPDAPESKLFVGLMRKYGKGLNLKSKINNNKLKAIQKTFSIEGKNIILKETKGENNKL